MHDLMSRRYATKMFDPQQRISAADIDQVKALLRLAPSSVNSQPWKFILASSQTSKERIAQAAHGPYEANIPKILQASHVLVMCARTQLSDEYLARLLQIEQQAGRFADELARNLAANARKMYVNLHRDIQADVPHWTRNQVYLNLGSLLVGVASLNIDAVPIEGIDFAMLDKTFALSEAGFSAAVVVALGYRDPADYNQPERTPKARLPLEEVLVEL